MVALRQFGSLVHNVQEGTEVLPKLPLRKVNGRDEEKFYDGGSSQALGVCRRKSQMGWIKAGRV